MSSFPFPSAHLQQRQEPIVVKIPKALFEQIGNYLGGLPWKSVQYLRPSMLFVQAGQLDKDEIQIDKVLLDAVLALLVNQPYDQVNEVMTQITNWIKFTNTKVPQSQESTNPTQSHHV